MTRDRWPAWLRTLRPDEVARRRLRRAILEEARPILALRRGDWLDAVSEWATVLSPVAAAVTLIFAGLALRQAGDAEPFEGAVASAPAVEELVHPGQVLPSSFGPDSTADLDAVLIVLYEAEAP